MSDWRGELERAFDADAVTVREDAPTLLAPDSEEAAVEAMRFAGSHGLRVRPCGNETLSRSRADLALSSRRWSGITTYEPGDGTLTARSGTLWRSVREAVTAGGHHASPDVASERATLGGVLVAAREGRDRLRYGPVRDQVLGMRVLLADGTIAKSGGQLVKNVTGYDLHRLYTGSRGSLCFVLEASLRLWPRPEERCLLARDFAGAEDAFRTAREVARLARRPETVTAVRAKSGWTLHVVLAGPPAVVADERARLERAGLAPHDLDGLDELRSRHEPERPHLWISCLPSQVAGVVAKLGAKATLVNPDVATVLAEADGGDELASAWDPAGVAGPRPSTRRFPCTEPVVHDDSPAARWMERLRAGLDPESRLAGCAP